MFKVYKLQFRNELNFKTTHNVIHHKHWFPKVPPRFTIQEAFRVYCKDAGVFILRRSMETLLKNP